MTGPSGLRIDPRRTALLVVDIQERLLPAMPAADLAACLRNVTVLCELGRRLRMPVVVSEQYPKGLGPTAGPVADALAAPGLEVRRFEKLEFGCGEAPAFEPIFRELGRDTWIVTGMEAHVCVYQTVRGLLERGASVHLPVDAVTSRTTANRDVGLGLIARAGGILTSTEVVVFDALGRAGTEDFKALSKLVK